MLFSVFHSVISGMGLLEGTGKFWKQRTNELVAWVLSTGGMERAKMTFFDEGCLGHI